VGRILIISIGEKFSTVSRGVLFLPQGVTGTVQSRAKPKREAFFIRKKKGRFPVFSFGGNARDSRKRETIGR